MLLFMFSSEEDTVDHSGTRQRRMEVLVQVIQRYHLRSALRQNAKHPHKRARSLSVVFFVTVCCIAQISVVSLVNGYWRVVLHFTERR